MNRSSDGGNNDSYLKKEPIAIVGMGCRFPGGADNPELFWKNLVIGADAIGEIPLERWSVDAFFNPDSARPAKSYVRYGGFLENIDLFDAKFFGIPPREAMRIDPQQRILLEVAYETLEDAGVSLESISATKTGVFIGIATLDYGGIQLSKSERNSINAYSNLGLAMCIAANRISYFFNLKGPSLAIDTACSSSLVAAHYACQSIWSGESEQTLVGGVGLIIRPEGTIGFSKASMLSPKGRCRSFDAEADGYIRSEGAGTVLLKPLKKAIDEGNYIYAVIHNTVVNQDGRTAGIALPNPQAQQSMLREAYSSSQLDAQLVQYVEAHGTGTLAGDPIEMNSIGSVIGWGRADGNECIVGSVKSNIGHLEAASGIAGLIKTALALDKGIIPPNLHFKTPNPGIDFKGHKLRVPTAPEPWPDNSGFPRMAAVNSFGFGGTNAHIVIGEVTDNKAISAISVVDQDKRSLLYPISARSPEALKAMAQLYLDLLDQCVSDEKGFSMNDLAYSTSLHRSHYQHRLAVVADSPQCLQEKLEAFVNNENRPQMVDGHVKMGVTHKIVFVFSGMGSQWWAMGKNLIDTEPVFRDVFSRCDQLLETYSGWSLIAELQAEEEDSRINRASVAQPAIFALQVSLAALWESWGVKPDLVVGHSVGEVAAAHVSGALSLEDSVRLIYHRSRLQQTVAGQGAMLAVGMSKKEVDRLIDGYEGLISVAAINSPDDLTLSGDRDLLEKIAAELEKDLIFNRFLQVDIPYHSVKMDSLKEELLESLKGIAPHSGTIPYYSTATGYQVDGSELGPAYWWSNVRNPVFFSEAINGILEDGGNLFIEVSAHPVLSGSVIKCLANAGFEGNVIPSLRRKEPERASLLTGLGRLYSLGYDINWKLQFTEGGRYVKLPLYPWQRERFWNESEKGLRDRLGVKLHPLLGNRVDSAEPVWIGEIEFDSPTYLTDHSLQGRVIFPAAGYVEMALAAGRDVYGEGVVQIEDLNLRRALFLAEESNYKVQFLLDKTSHSFNIYSRMDAADYDWVNHASGKVSLAEPDLTAERIDLNSLSDDFSTTVSADQFYDGFEKIGLNYGPLFRGVKNLLVGEGKALATVELNPDLSAHLEQYYLHPALLDASFQALLGAVMLQVNRGDERFGLYLPVAIERIRFFRQPGQTIISLAVITEYSDSSLKGDLTIYDQTGEVVAVISGFTCQAMERVADNWQQYLSRYEWQLKEPVRENYAFRSASFFNNPSAIIDSLTPEFHQMIIEHNRKQYYEEVAPQEFILTRAYILGALIKLGWQPELGQSFTTEKFCLDLKILPHHTRLTERFLLLLAEEEILKESDRVWEVAALPSLDDLDLIWKSAWQKFPAYQAELTLIRQCGEKLAEVLCGEVDPLQLIFPEGSLTLAEHLYQDSPSYRIYNLMAQKVVARVIEDLPEDKRIRILEVGGGTGGLTAYVVKKLPVEQSEYIFSDVTPFLLTQSEQKFRQYPFLRYEILDIEEDPLEQGFKPHSFDLIIASDVLHATRDLTVTLGNVKKLLASEGLLLLLEGTKTSSMPILVFGLLKGWWLFTDVKNRGADPWINQDAWQSLLEQSGFSDFSYATDSVDRHQAVHSIIVARGPQVELSPTADSEIGLKSDLLETDRGRWLIFADQGGVGKALAISLAGAGVQVTMVTAGDHYNCVSDDSYSIDPTLPDQMDLLISEVAGEESNLLGVIHLWSLDAAKPPHLEDASLATANDQGVLNVLSLIQNLSKYEMNSHPSLWLITAGAQPVIRTDPPIAVAQSPLWGFNRVICNEYPQFRCKIVDLSSECRQEEVNLLLDEIRAVESEDEIALRGQARYVHRLKRVSVVNASKDGKAAGGLKIPPYSVEISKMGVLSNLYLQEIVRQKPGPGEIEIEVKAAGLNFKDVMLAMGMLPDEALKGGFTGKTLGMECSGIVTSLGECVENCKVGDEVITSAPGSLRSHIVINSEMAIPKPEQISFEEAATIMIAFLTAHYSLNYLGRMQPGERVLIHAAAGGVGLAAVQLAQQAGAEVYATAGTPVKRDLLKMLGVKYVMDSRSLAFADQVIDYTGGKGVDIVLNSLSGPSIPKSLSVLSAYGRFIEIGKRDIYEDSKIGLRPFYNNISFMAVDLDRLCAERPELIRSFLGELLPLFTENILRPLPHRVFSVSDISTAFRFMAQARHIGKVVISMADSGHQVISRTRQGIDLSEDATYLIAGGLGGFGFATAKWLEAKGARNIVLLSRSACPDAPTEEAIRQMRNRDINLVVHKADITDRSALADALKVIRREMPPIRGVIHTAMVLDDALLAQLNPARVKRVLAPKVNGAWNLHMETLNDPLEMFVAFSSYTTIIGNPGQGNYVAANAFLDALAYYRNACGLPALTVNWGAVADVGYVAENPDISNKLEHIGVKAMPADQLLIIMEKLLANRVVQAGVGLINWSQLAQVKLIHNAPRLTFLEESMLEQDSLMQGSSLVDELYSIEETERLDYLVNKIKEQLARIIGMSAAQIDTHQPLIEMGLDSLMAVEVGNQVKSMVNVEVPAMKFMEGLTISGMSSFIIDQLNLKRKHSDSEADYEDKTAKAVENLTDHEVDSLLEELLTDETEPLPDRKEGLI